MKYHVHLDGWLLGVFATEAKAEDFLNDLIDSSECTKIFSYDPVTDSDTHVGIWYYSAEYDIWFQNVSIDTGVF